MKLFKKSSRVHVVRIPRDRVEAMLSILRVNIRKATGGDARRLLKSYEPLIVAALKTSGEDMIEFSGPVNWILELVLACCVAAVRFDVGLAAYVGQQLENDT